LLEPTPRNLAELTWRLGLPASALILSLIAIPLAFVNPRAGRSMNLVLALLIFMSYTNLLSITQAQVAQSRLHFAAALAVHAAMLALAAGLFLRRIMVVPLRRLFG
jgi:lipopolysaccharide export system permease protein